MARKDDDGLSELEKETVLHAARGRMIDLLSDDREVRLIATAYPDEIVRVFMAGCQAGADAAIRLLDLRVEGS